VASNGKSVTIETADGYSVTLTHLGSIAVAKGATVAEQDMIGTVGPSGTPEVDVPYVHLGIRVTADPDGYVDPLGLLPPAPTEPVTQTGTTTSQPAANGGSSTAPASKPAAAAPSRPRVRSAEPVRTQVRLQRHERAQRPRADTSRGRARQRPEVRGRRGDPIRSSQRAVSALEVARPIDLGAGHESRPAPYVAPRRRAPSSPLLALVCDLAAALFALGVALGARRQRPNTGATMGARVLCLPPREAASRQVSRAA
jgi:pyruvate/2-oxoglutarate dehydrogenase complex dihydrolipoamide acyltransferase (E2) component